MDESKNDMNTGIVPGLPQEANKEKHSPNVGFLHEAFEIIKVLLISIAIVLPIRYFIAQPFIVRGASMEPNFYDGEYLIIDEVTYNFRNPARGEVIVFHYPRDPGQFFIKRIVGLPGERVEITNGRVSIFNNENPNGIRIDESYLMPPNRATYPDEIVMLGASEYFLLGDNRDFSSDSRVWGPMDSKFMVGRTLFRAWPFDSVGLVTQ